MEVGDFVIILDTEDGGKITKILSKSKIEILLDNGFTIRTSTDKIKIGEEPVRFVNHLPKKHKVTLPPIKVDLHMECLIDDHTRLNNAEKVILQLEAFESQLSAAIAGGMFEITFIHGIGSGVLRDQIRKSLKENKHIKSYADAQYDRGATLVKIY